MSGRSHAYARGSPSISVHKQTLRTASINNMFSLGMHDRVLVKFNAVRSNATKPLLPLATLQSSARTIFFCGGDKDIHVRVAYDQDSGSTVPHHGWPVNPVSAPPQELPQSAKGQPSANSHPVNALTSATACAVFHLRHGGGTPANSIFSADVVAVLEIERRH